MLEARAALEKTNNLCAVGADALPDRCIGDSEAHFHNAFVRSRRLKMKWTIGRLVRRISVLSLRDGPRYFDQGFGIGEFWRPRKAGAS